MSSRLVRSSERHSWLDVAKAAKHLSVSQRQIYRWVQQKRLPHTKLGNRLLFTTEQLDEFVEQNTHSPASPDTVRRHGVGEVAEYFGVTVTDVRGWVEQGLLQPDDPSGATLFSLESLGNFQRANPDLF